MIDLSPNRFVLEIASPTWWFRHQRPSGFPHFTDFDSFFMSTSLGNSKLMSRHSNGESNLIKLKEWRWQNWFNNDIWIRFREGKWMERIYRSPNPLRGFKVTAKSSRFQCPKKKQCDRSTLGTESTTKTKDNFQTQGRYYLLSDKIIHAQVKTQWHWTLAGHIKFESLQQLHSPREVSHYPFIVKQCIVIGYTLDPRTFN